MKKRVAKFTIVVCFAFLCFAAASVPREKEGQNFLGTLPQTLAEILSEQALSAQEETDCGLEEMKEEQRRIPTECQWIDGDMLYDPYDTIYYKDYYEHILAGGELITIALELDINIQEELEDYFYPEDNWDWDNLAEMFYDNRTIEMSEEELKDLFYQHGFMLYLHGAKMGDLNVRFVEIAEIDGLSLYPVRILMQTWDESHIYLQDITGPIPRKIRSFLVVDDKEAYQLIVHSTGFSTDYVAEEELSFWEYRRDGNYWVLTPMALETDTSHAYIMPDREIYTVLDKDELFEPAYYRDGIAYRPSVQGEQLTIWTYELLMDAGFEGSYSEAVNEYTYRLGVMEEIEKNRIFRLYAVCDVSGKAAVINSCYIQFEII